MQALKYQVVVSRDSTVVVNVPAPAGERAEVIVLLSSDDNARRANMKALLQRWSRLPGGRTADDIDAELAAEHASWED